MYVSCTWVNILIINVLEISLATSITHTYMWICKLASEQYHINFKGIPYMCEWKLVTCFISLNLHCNPQSLLHSNLYMLQLSVQISLHMFLKYVNMCFFAVPDGSHCQLWLLLDWNPCIFGYWYVCLLHAKCVITYFLYTCNRLVTVWFAYIYVHHYVSQGADLGFSEGGG